MRRVEQNAQHRNCVAKQFVVFPELPQELSLPSKVENSLYGGHFRRAEQYP